MPISCRSQRWSWCFKGNLLCDVKSFQFFIPFFFQVLCSGEGLRQGIVGKEIRSWIDTRRAGPGELTAHCTGPRKVAYCELYDHGDATFTLNVKPQEAGRHALTIKYSGQHVPGSPFTLRVAGAPDASKVWWYRKWRQYLEEINNKNNIKNWLEKNNSRIFKCNFTCIGSSIWPWCWAWSFSIVPIEIYLRY